MRYRILPPETLPADGPVVRQHKPMKASGERGYTEYRACLRQDFAFTCALCLSHEKDLFKHGVEGTGLTAAEHVLTKSSRDDLRNEYANLVYGCRFCNGNRGTKPNVGPKGAALLDPTNAVWSAHFERDGHRLKARSGDADASYTHLAYNLDDRRKVEMRRVRSESIRTARRLVNEGPPEIARLRAAAVFSAPAKKAENLRAAELLTLSVDRARIELASWNAVPDDMTDCGCELKLSCVYAAQWEEFESD